MRVDKLDYGELVSLISNEKVRSSKWSKVKKAFLLKKPQCVACNIATIASEVDVHHIIPYHYCIAVGRPDLEFDERNFITLCGETNDYQHHLLLGHCGDWQTYNPTLLEDIRTYKGKTYTEIIADKNWIDKRKKKIKHLLQMTDTAKKALKEILDTMYPLQ
jgi:5-methylcytosine-specific restriction endonuclease McrA